MRRLRGQRERGDNSAMPPAELPILVIDENRIRASIIEDGLREAGHSEVTVVTEINEVARVIERQMPDVVVIDLENPNRDRLEHFFTLSRALRKPIAMFVDRSDASAIEAAVEAGVSAYVVDGLKKERVKPILETTISRFRAFARLKAELEEAKTQLEERKAIDRAKMLLMKMKGIDEEAAYHLLRRTAMNEKKRIVDIAQSIITAAELLR